MTAFLAVVMLVISLLACYLPAVAGAHGRGSRKLWIMLFFAGLIVGGAAMMLGHQLVRPFDPFFVVQSEGGSLAHRMVVELIILIVRASISFCFGTFLAILLYKKRQTDSASLLGLGER
jgi:hypothetical protein